MGVTNKCFFYCKGNILSLINTQWQLQLSKTNSLSVNSYKLTLSSESSREVVGKMPLKSLSLKTSFFLLQALNQ